MSKLRKINKWAIIGSLVLLFAVGSAIFAFVSSSTSASPASTSISEPLRIPVQMVGTWTGKAGGISVTADITEGQIQIDLAMPNGMTGVYWIGTFDTVGHMTTSFKVTSKGDTEAMSTKLLASQDATKVFSYDKGDLSYPFSMVGVSMTVHLARSPQ